MSDSLIAEAGGEVEEQLEQPLPEAADGSRAAEGQAEEVQEDVLAGLGSTLLSSLEDEVLEELVAGGSTLLSLAADEGAPHSPDD